MFQSSNFCLVIIILKIEKTKLHGLETWKTGLQLQSCDTLNCYRQR